MWDNLAAFEYIMLSWFSIFACKFDKSTIGAIKKFHTLIFILSICYFKIIFPLG